MDGMGMVLQVASRVYVRLCTVSVFLFPEVPRVGWVYVFLNHTWVWFMFFLVVVQNI